MSLPNTITSGDSVSASPVQSNFSDIATELTGSLPRDGQAGMTGQLKAADGTAAAPGITFNSDSNTGFYRSAGDTFHAVAGGSAVAEIDTGGITMASGMALVDQGGTTVVGIPTGAMMMYGATSAPTGWVRLNGLTIGNGSSAATERANADTSSLFSFLWTNYSDTVCAVSGGRGASAAADYAANKAIALPDLRDRAVAGLGTMGNSAASRVTSAVSSIDTSVNGASGGAQSHTVAQNNLPNVNFTVAGTTAGHTHTALTRGVAFGSDVTAFVVSNHTSTAPIPSATDTVAGTAASGGSGTAISHMPPAFFTTFIMKL